ncbi:MAG: hypothetical protein U5K74_06155 [Gemmatimonadaceae bacterium]|nr:hypothetical protein [Gemmatimonadaceae bacterium]
MRIQAGDGFGFVFHNGVHNKVPHVGRCIVGDDVEIGANSTVEQRQHRRHRDRRRQQARAVLVHVGHNVRVGRLCLFAAGVAIAGSTRIGDGVMLAGQDGRGRTSHGRRWAIDDRGSPGVSAEDVPAGQTWGDLGSDRTGEHHARGYAAVGENRRVLLQRMEHR